MQVITLTLPSLFDSAELVAGKGEGFGVSTGADVVVWRERSGTIPEKISPFFEQHSLILRKLFNLLN